MEILMKKFLKILGIVILILVIIVAGLAIWQWKYVKALIDGVRYDQAAIGEQSVKNAENTISAVNDQLTAPLREMTDEEKEKIASGELSQTAVMAQIIAEATGISLPAADAVSSAAADADDNSAGDSKVDSEAGSSDSGNSAGGNSSGGNSEGSGSSSAESASSSADLLIADAVSQLYVLQSQYTSQIEGLVSRAKAYYNEQKTQSGSTAAKSSTLAKFSGEVASMESSCDSKVEAVLSELTANLNAIGADTSVVSTLRTAYRNEKASQRAAYVNKYSSKL